MKNNEYYFNKWNKYVEQITNITPIRIELKNMMGVTTTIKAEYFNDNYVKCNDVYNLIDTILSAFIPAKVLFDFQQNFISINKDDVAFGVVNDMLRVVMSDEIRDILELDNTIEDFMLEDAETIINMIADLYKED